MTDTDTLNFLAERLGNFARLAEALNVSPQTIHNWRMKRGIAWRYRGKVLDLANEHHKRLPKDFLHERIAP